MKYFNSAPKLKWAIGLLLLMGSPLWASEDLCKFEKVAKASTSPKPLFEGPIPFATLPPTKEQLSPLLQSAFKSDAELMKVATYGGSNPEITSIKDLSAEAGAAKGSHYFRITAEVGGKIGSRIFYAQFPSSLRIYDVISQNGNSKIYDVTHLGIPTQPLWAHYKVSTGIMAVQKDKNQIMRGTVNGTEIFYSASSKETSDVFIPLKSPELLTDYRSLTMQPQFPSLFQINNEGTVVGLMGMSTEEGDGPLAFGLRGGGRTGWNPWSAKYQGVVSNVEAGQINLLKDAKDLLMPPLIEMK